MWVELQMKTSHLPWAKKEQTGTLINLQKVFGDYLRSNMREITVPGQQLSFPTGQLYLMEKRRGRCRWRI